MNGNIIIDGDKIILIGSFTFQSVSPIYNKLMTDLLQKKLNNQIYIDFKKTIAMDSAGVALLNELEEYLISQKIQYQFINLSENLKDTIHSFSYILKQNDKEVKENESILLTIGGKMANLYQDGVNFLVLFVDTIFFSYQSIFRKKLYRKDSFWEHSLTIGVDALTIIGLMSFLIGLILALQSAAQLRQFGANIFIANLIGIAMVREMGPLMTAIMLAGRSGSAIASEIATMKVTEEIDALRMMGLNPIGFIIAPKFLAISLVTPILTIYSDFLGIFGGYLIGITYLDLPSEAFFNQLFTSITAYDIIVGLFKSLVFAWIIVIVGSYFGIQVKGGAEGVGKKTTQSVVTSIFLVILTDSLFSLIFYFGG